MTRRAIIFDWYDGPRAGVCALETPEREFWFELVAERENQDDLEDRIFRLFDLPSGSVDGLLQQLGDLKQTSGRVWVPIWRHPSPAVLQRLSRAVESVRRRATATGDFLFTRDMIHFLASWRVEEDVSVDDWFSFLGA
ncbi:MAG: hypothetical protein R3F20_09135 [Planctomycetota bacterium]